jgi:hypothetical protein
MNYAALRDAILNGPHAAACAPFVINFDAPKTPGAYINDQTIADVLNSAPGGVTYRSRFVTARVLLAELDPMAAATILDKLEAAAVVNSAVKWAMKYITTDGIDIGHPSTQGMLQQLAAGGVLDATEADAVIGLAGSTVPYGEFTFGAPVTAADVSIALRGGAAYDPRV